MFLLAIFAESNRQYEIQYKKILNGGKNRSFPVPKHTFRINKEENEQRTCRLSSNNEEIILESNTFHDFSANGIMFDDSFGGALNIHSNTTRIKNCIFTSCFAKYAGAAAIYECSVDIEMSTFDSNECSNDIGALWLMTCSEASVNETNFTNNVAQEDFGALASNQTNLVIQTCFFEYNNASSGTDLAITNGKSTNIKYSAFLSSKANNIYIEDTSKVTFACCIFNQKATDVMTLLGEVSLTINEESCSGSKIECIPFSKIDASKINIVKAGNEIANKQRRGNGILKVGVMAWLSLNFL